MWIEVSAQGTRSAGDTNWKESYQVTCYSNALSFKCNIPNFVSAGTMYISTAPKGLGRFFSFVIYKQSLRLDSIGF
jgi:hypothetical protein